MASQVVLVTGCSKGGIGYALCEEFATRGYIVYATARKLESMGGFKSPNIRTRCLDVTDDAAVTETVEGVLGETGRIDILVSNAGALAIGPILDVPLSQVQANFDVNTFAFLRLARATIPHMAKRRSGLIINVGSVTGIIPSPFNGIYSAAKAASHALTETLRVECSPFNINVILVAPGAVKSMIASNHAPIYKQPEDSLYKSFSNLILARLSYSQTAPGSMPNDVFAKQVLEKALRKNPPASISIGGTSWSIWFLSWLPRSWAMWIVWRAVSRTR